jgi:hypothetical protein
VPTIEQVIADGLRWLYEVEQPERAVGNHHGEGIRAEGHEIRFCASGRSIYPLVIINRIVRYRDHDHSLSEEIVGRVRSAIAACGRAVGDTWNGPPSDTMTFELVDQALESQRRAIARYPNREHTPEDWGRYVKPTWTERS